MNKQLMISIIDAAKKQLNLGSSELSLKLGHHRNYISRVLHQENPTPEQMTKVVDKVNALIGEQKESLPEFNPIIIADANMVSLKELNDLHQTIASQEKELDHKNQVLDKRNAVLENVKMKKDFEQYITHHTTQALGCVEKTLINSALVSAQNRQRYYWTNFEVTQPDDKGVLLKDILEYPMDDKYKLSDEAVARFKPCQKTNSGQIGTTAHEGTIGQRDRVYDANGKMITLTATIYKQPPQYINGSKLRKLTPIECERLQTLPDNWTSMLSNTQRYRSIGNGWTIDVIAHILKHI